MLDKRFTLKKKQRIVGNDKLTNNVVHCRANMLTLLAEKNSFGFARIKVVVPKRHVALAVKRNRIKRWVKESFRVRQYALASVDVVVIYRGSRDFPTFQQCQKAFSKLIGIYQRLS